MTNFEREFTVFTDGSALNNKQDAPAGWCFYIPSLEVLESGKMIGTNNQAELQAIFHGLSWIDDHTDNSRTKTQKIYLLSDSIYAVKAVNGEHKVKVNQDLINECKTLVEHLKDKKIKISYIHVDAHTGKKDFVSSCNDIVDRTARERALEMKAMKG